MNARSFLRKAGFTLMELLIAIAVFTIISTAIYSSLRAGIRVWNRSNRMIESFQSARVFFAVVSADLKNAVILDPDAAGFEGTGSGMAFMSVVTAAGGERVTAAEPAMVAYYLDSGTRTLKRAAARKAEGFDPDKADAVDIFTGVGAGDIGFEYCYKSSGGNAGYEWKDEWKDTGKIPIGVRIRVKGSTRYIFIPTGEAGREERS